MKTAWQHILNVLIGLAFIVVAPLVVVGIPFALGEVFQSPLVAGLSLAVTVLITSHQVGEWLREQEW